MKTNNTNTDTQLQDALNWWKALSIEQCKKMFAKYPEFGYDKEGVGKIYVQEMLKQSFVNMAKKEVPTPTEIEVAGSMVGGEWKVKFDEQEFLPQGEKHTYIDSIVDNEGNEICSFLTSHHGQIEDFAKYEAIALRIVQCVNGYDKMMDFINRMASIKLPNGTVNGDYINHIVDEAKALINTIENK